MKGAIGNSDEASLMKLGRWITSAIALTFVACATARVSNLRTPLGAMLEPGARTGATVPLRADPNARVILSSAAGLPAASFLPAQAARGADIYKMRCTNCHASGELIGQRFVDEWNNRRVYDLYALVRSTMPLSNPGSMKDQEYLDLTAYLLQANHHTPLGRDSLAADTTTMRKARIAVSLP